MLADAPSSRTCSSPKLSQVFVRMGLLTAMVDSPVHSAMTNTKGSNASTKHPCAACNISHEELKDWQCDFQRKRRTAEGIDADIAYAEAGSTAHERGQRAMHRGVTPPNLPNPLKRLTFDRVRQIGVDVLHQDAIVSDGWPTIGQNFILQYKPILSIYREHGNRERSSRRSRSSSRRHTRFTPTYFFTSIVSPRVLFARRLFSALVSQPATAVMPTDPNGCPFPVCFPCMLRFLCIIRTRHGEC